MIITAHGHRIAVEREGRGRPLVLIHGLGTPSVWNRVRERLSESFELFIIHLPGFGSSEPTRGRLSAHDHAHLVEALLDEFQVARAALCGISYGGQVAATLAAESPERCSALILINASGLITRYRTVARVIPFHFLGQLAVSVLLRSEAAVRRWNGRLYYDASQQPHEIVREFFQMISDRDRRKNWLDCLRNAAAPEEAYTRLCSRITSRTLILWANDDRIIPVRYAQEYQRVIRNAKLGIFQRCGHALPLEKPDELCATVQDFLKAEMPHT